MNQQSPHLYEFGAFRLEPKARLLLREGQPVTLTPKVFDTLLLLVQRHGQLLEKEQLMKELWPDSFVEESNLTYNISTLRKALNDKAADNPYIVTVSGRGYRFAAEVREVGPEADTKRDEDAPPTQATLKKKPVLIATLLVLVVVLSGFIIYRIASQPKLGTESAKAIAVLPFQLQGAEPNLEAEYLSDGLTESIINNLTPLPNLRVMARSTVFRYKNEQTDPVAIGKELGVQMVLTGRVILHADSLTISAELVDVQANRQVWGEQYNRKMTGLLALQGEITHEVVNKLRVKLSGADEQRLAKKYTENAEAYQLYLKARFYLDRRMPKDVGRAHEACQQAIAMDPNYALAYVGLANAYSLPPIGTPPHEWMLKARETALKALALDDNLAEAHTALGRILVVHDYDFAAAEREYRRAIELNPNFATAHHRYGEVLGILGRHQEASAEFLRALELEPLSIVFNVNYGLFLILARRYDDAIAQLKKALELDERTIPAHGNLSMAYKLTGNYAECIEEHAKALEVIGNNQEAAFVRGSFAKGGWEGYLRSMVRTKESSYNLATWHVELGEKDKAIANLNKAYKNREIFIALLNIDPRFDPLRSDPRFQDLLRRVGFTP